MGTTGSGKFTDYPGTSKKQGTAGVGGGIEPADRCQKAFSAVLEDVEHCEYFKTHNAAPKKGTTLRVAHKKRVVAETEVGIVVGNLPTGLNYLAACLHDGFTYVGTIRDATNGPPIATVTADFAAVPPK